MAAVKPKLLQRIRRFLVKDFPAATVTLENIDGVVGVIASKKFDGMDALDRQTLIGHVLDQHLTRQEQRQIQIIVGVTPREREFYEATSIARPQTSVQKKVKKPTVRASRRKPTAPR